MIEVNEYVRTNKEITKVLNLANQMLEEMGDK
nr:MAG TPA: hypothetical protein [Caudoviricetes sp.]